MRLTDAALKAINTKQIRPLLALALNKSESTIIRYIGDNEDNGMLTTVAAISLIKKETGLKQSEILEEKEFSKAV